MYCHVSAFNFFKNKRYKILCSSCQKWLAVKPIYSMKYTYGKCASILPLTWFTRKISKGDEVTQSVLSHQAEESSGSFTESQDEEPTEVINIHAFKVRNWSGNCVRSESLSLLMLQLCLWKKKISRANFLEESQSSPRLPKPKTAVVMTRDLNHWCGTLLYLSFDFHCYNASKGTGRLILALRSLVLWVVFGFSISHLQELGLQSWSKLSLVHGFHYLLTVCLIPSWHGVRSNSPGMCHLTFLRYI